MKKLGLLGMLAKEATIASGTTIIRGRGLSSSVPITG